MFFFFFFFFWGGWGGDRFGREIPDLKTKNTRINTAILCYLNEGLFSISSPSTDLLFTAMLSVKSKEHFFITLLGNNICNIWNFERSCNIYSTASKHQQTPPDHLTISTGYKRVCQFMLLAETVRHIWLPPRLSVISCFLLRLPSPKNGFLQRLPCDSASCRDSLQEAKLHGQSLQGTIYPAQ